MKISVFGTGYVGLTQGAVLAEVGHDVVCVDIDAAKVARLAKGEITIFEPGLAEMVKANHAAGRLSFTTDAAAAVAHGDVIFLAVGTPSAADGSADMSQVMAVAATIAEHAAADKLVVTKSTAPVGTGDAVEAAIKDGLAARGADVAIEVASNPEFLKEGAAVADCMRPDRIIIGTEDAGAIATLRELYQPFNRNHDRIIVMDRRSAELTKYAANCMLATKISFMNEMAGLAEKLGADIEAIRLGIGSDSRIGHHFIYAGAGYGGSCFPKDVQALVHMGREAGFPATIMEAVQARNAAQQRRVFEKIEDFFQGDLSGKTVALWGLAFKANTDDMREASSRVLMEALWQAGVKVQAYDPKAMATAKAIYGARDDLTFAASAMAALDGADVLAVMTEWQEFRAPDFAKISSVLRHKAVFDGRNLYAPENVRRHGLRYFGIGRGD